MRLVQVRVVLGLWWRLEIKQLYSLRRGISSLSQLPHLLLHPGHLLSQVRLLAHPHPADLGLTHHLLCHGFRLSLEILQFIEVPIRPWVLLWLPNEAYPLSNHAPMEPLSHRPEPDHRPGRRCPSYTIRGAGEHLQELQDVLHHHELLVEEKQIQEG